MYRHAHPYTYRHVRRCCTHIDTSKIKSHTRPALLQLHGAPEWSSHYFLAHISVKKGTRLSGSTSSSLFLDMLNAEEQNNYLLIVFRTYTRNLISSTELFALKGENIEIYSRKWSIII